MIILGVKLLESKMIFSELLKIYGIGISRSYIICKKLGLLNKRVSFLLKYDINLLLNELNLFLLESNLKLFIISNINRLIKINCYRGIRHLKRLPVRGQRTRTNSRTARKIINFNND